MDLEERNQSSLPSSGEADGLPHDARHYMYENVLTIAALTSDAEQAVDDKQRFVERVARRIGHPTSIYWVVGAVLVWVTFNVATSAFLRSALDPPPFFWMQGAVSLFALLTTLVVLTTQNRQGRKAEREAKLELQINLHAEQKIAKLVQLVEELRRDLPSVANRPDPTAETMSHAADPHAIVHAIERTEEKLRLERG